MDEVERRFHQAMVAIYETSKRELGYNATRFLQMVSEQGGLVTARQLLWSDTPSDGFTTLLRLSRETRRSAVRHRLGQQPVVNLRSGAPLR